MSSCIGLSCQPRSPHHMLRDVQLLPGTSHPSEELAQQQESTLLLWAISLPTLHKSLLMSLIFLVCKMSISSKTNHFGTISTITEQPLFSTLENNIPKHLQKVTLLHSALYTDVLFQAWKMPLGLYQQSASSDIFQASPAPATLQTKPIKR